MTPRAPVVAGAAKATHRHPPRLEATELSRLLPLPVVTKYAAHLDRYGPMPLDRPAAVLLDAIERSGLRGRGGAGFPTATKLGAVLAQGKAAMVVANGTEGEPISHKDKVLLRFAPHLVIDGIDQVVRALGARGAQLCIDRTHPDLFDVVDAALAERSVAGRLHRPIELLGAPHRYLTGEESALVHWLNGGDAKPTLVPPRPFERGVDGRPTMLSNVETYAHIGLIARFGPDWYRAVGTPDAPGTVLATVTGGVAQPGVFEAPGGLALTSLLEAAGGDPAEIEAVLVGGYFGTWIPADKIAQVRLDPPSLAAVGSSFGCGVVFALPRGHCGLFEVARVTRWLADQNAGQCGPCVNGLDAVARAVRQAVRTGGSPRDIQALLSLVKGRGACRLPDGVARFVDSSLRVFARDLEHHRRHGACTVTKPLLPTPKTGGWR